MLRSRQNESAMIIRRASAIAQKLNSVELGVEKSLMITDLKRRLRFGVVRFLFQKSDGSLRLAFGTLDRVLLRSKIKGTGVSPEKHGCCCFFDVEKGEFRSFRWENLIAVYRN